jgi:hypothetical protein
MSRQSLSLENLDQIYDGMSEAEPSSWELTQQIYQELYKTLTIQQSISSYRDLI